MRPNTRSPNVYFLLEGLNSCGTVYFAYYLYFFLREHFGFGNLGNLTFSALNGFVYIFAAWYGGKFAQRFGYHTALASGLVTMICILLVGWKWQTLSGQIVVMVIWTIGMCFTWPSLEALIGESVPAAQLPRAVGIYNVVWSGAGAATYFCGGALFQTFGQKSVFLLPVVIHLIALVIVALLGKSPDRRASRQADETPAIPHDPQPQALKRSFLRMAWFANPFAYVAINTVVAVIPAIATRLEFTPTTAGFFCSIWFFARLGTFVLLWQWTAWHYRFGWLAAAFAGLVASFTTLLLVPNVAVLACTQLIFGVSVGLIYYSSLFYSMDVGENKGEHGGIHEAAIGLGIFAGPAVGATALRLFPAQPNSGAWAVSALLALGFFTLLSRRRMNGNRKT